MKPVKFQGYTNTYAKDQPPYLPLPFYKAAGGEIMSCWALSWQDRLRALFTGRIWVTMLTFYRPLQPHRLTTKQPKLEARCWREDLRTVE